VAKTCEWARQQMSPAHFHHTEGVVETVTQLAERHGIASVASLRLAGWIHDAAKERPDGQPYPEQTVSSPRDVPHKERHAQLDSLFHQGRRN